jgi:SAM-dependent methyltransferase
VVRGEEEDFRRIKASIPLGELGGDRVVPSNDLKNTHQARRRSTPDMDTLGSGTGDGKVMANPDVYNRADVAEFYRSSERLHEAEEYLFERYIAPGSDTIDIGVGGGRTTPALSKFAKNYLGIDYSSAMVDVCRQRFPHLSFACADATNLSDIADDS